MLPFSACTCLRARPILAWVVFCILEEPTRTREGEGILEYTATTALLSPTSVVGLPFFFLFFFHQWKSESMAMDDGIVRFYAAML